KCRVPPRMNRWQQRRGFYVMRESRRWYWSPMRRHRSECEVSPPKSASTHRFHQPVGARRSPRCCVRAWVYRLPASSGIDASTGSSNSHLNPASSCNRSRVLLGAKTFWPLWPEEFRGYIHVMTNDTTPQEAVERYLNWLEDPSSAVDQEAVAAARRSFLSETNQIARLHAAAELSRIE